MLDLLSASVASGTGHQAALSVDTFGKTGTTQDNRDALFIGFAGDLVTGVWVGNDDNTPNAGLSGGGLPARVWRDFMMQALRVGPAEAPAPAPTVDNASADEPESDNMIDDTVTDAVGAAVPVIAGQLEGLGLNLTVGKDGSIKVTDRDDGDRQRDRPRRRDPRDQPRDGPRDALDTRRPQ